MESFRPEEWADGEESLLFGPLLGLYWALPAFSGFYDLINGCLKRTNRTKNMLFRSQDLFFFFIL